MATPTRLLGSLTIAANEDRRQLVLEDEAAAAHDPEIKYYYEFFKREELSGLFSEFDLDVAFYFVLVALMLCSAGLYFFNEDIIKRDQKIEEGEIEGEKTGVYLNYYYQLERMYQAVFYHNRRVFMCCSMPKEELAIYLKERCLQYKKNLESFNRASRETIKSDSIVMTGPLAEIDEDKTETSLFFVTKKLFWGAGKRKKATGEFGLIFGMIAVQVNHTSYISDRHLHPLNYTTDDRCNRRRPGHIRDPKTGKDCNKIHDVVGRNLRTQLH